VLNSLFKIFVQADRAFIVMKTEGGQLVPLATKVRREGADDTIRVSRTIVNQVMEAKEAILSADAASDQKFEMSQSIADFRIRAMMCAPLLDSEGKAMGVLQIDTLDQRKRFQKEDLDVLASVAAQAGIAIDNAQMHETALKQKAMERDLEVAKEVQKSFLPEKPPEVPGYRFFNYYQPANHIGAITTTTFRSATGGWRSSWPTWWGTAWRPRSSWPSSRPNRGFAWPAKATPPPRLPGSTTS